MSRIGTGVIVARFQVAELTLARQTLLQTALDRHARVIVFLGTTPAQGHSRDPLDFPSRAEMVRSFSPRIIAAPLADHGDDREWSLRLHASIREIAPHGPVSLYGGRDSFLRCYQRNYPEGERTGIGIEVIDQTCTDISGSKQREAIADLVLPTREFRHGVIYGSLNRYPVSYQAVDIAIWDPSRSQLLLVRKAGSREWRLPGGFVDPGDASLEAAAKREAREETGLEVEDLRYIASRRTVDWRYAQQCDKLMTALFTARNESGVIHPKDSEIGQGSWFDPHPLLTGAILVAENHQSLIELALSALTRPGDPRVSAPQKEVHA